MIDADQVSAVIVTRGDVPLDPILASLDFLHEVVVHDNSQASSGDLAVYGRYAALSRTERSVVLVQDDDVILPRSSVEALLAAYEPGEITANHPERFRHSFYLDHCLVGFGAIFDRDLPAQAFTRFLSWKNPKTWETIWGEVPDLDGPACMQLFDRACDVVFTALTPYALLDVPYADREFASDPNRMWRQPSHVRERQQVLDLARLVRDA